MNLDEVNFSTKPITLGERILCQRGSNGDMEAVAAFILARTSMTSDQVVELDDEDQIKVMEKINQAAAEGIRLQALLND